MTSLNRIELFLNIDLTNTRLRDGLKKKNKNQYYWFQNLYLIVKLSQDKWCVVGCNERTFDLLNDNVFCYDCKGYMYNSTNGYFHVLLMSPPHGLVVDHINIRPWDNRIDNLRIVTRKINNQNKSISSANTTGVTGVRKANIGNREYYETSIVDNNDITHKKYFSITKLGDIEAKRLACNQRVVWKVQYNYLGI